MDLAHDIDAYWLRLPTDRPPRESGWSLNVQDIDAYWLRLPIDRFIHPVVSIYHQVEPVPEVEIIQPSEFLYPHEVLPYGVSFRASSNNMLCILTHMLGVDPVLANLVNLVIRHTILYKMIWNIALNHAVVGNFFDPLIQPKFGVPSILHMTSHTPSIKDGKLPFDDTIVGIGLQVKFFLEAMAMAESEGRLEPVVCRRGC
nr:hypothetical protein Iba_chr01bCG4930 [Ipomoea batatas]